MAEGAYIEIRDPDGSVKIIPRGKMSDAEWEAIKEVARAKRAMPSDMEFATAVRDASPDAAGRTKAQAKMETVVNRSNERDRASARAETNVAATISEGGTEVARGGGVRGAAQAVPDTAKMSDVQYAQAIKDAETARTGKVEVKIGEPKMTKPGISDPKFPQTSGPEDAAKDAGAAGAAGGGLAPGGNFIQRLAKEVANAITGANPQSQEGGGFSDPEADAGVNPATQLAPRPNPVGRAVAQSGAPATAQSSSAATAAPAKLVQASGAGGGSPDTGASVATARGGAPEAPPAPAVSRGTELGDPGTVPYGTPYYGAGGGPGASLVNPGGLQSSAPVGNLDAPVGGSVPPNVPQQEAAALAAKNEAFQRENPAPLGVGPGGGSVSAGVRVPGVANIKWPENQDQSGAINQATEDAIAAENDAAKIVGERDRLAAGLADDRVRDQIGRQQRVQQINESVQKTLARTVSVIEDAHKVLTNPAQTPDPERYWKSHSKIMFAIGVGMLAHARPEVVGSVLNSVGQAIDRDIEAQKAEFEAPRAAAREVIGNAKSLYGMLRQGGLDSFEAEKASEAIGADIYANEMQKLAMASNSEMSRPKADAAIAQLRFKGANALDALNQHSQANAVAKATADTGRINAQSERIQVSAKAGATGGGRPLPAEHAKGIGKLVTAADSIDQLITDFQKATGGSAAGALGNKLLLSHIPTSVAHDYDKKREAFLRTIGLLVDDSVLMAHDMKHWETILPKSGDLNGMPGLLAVGESVRLKLRDTVSGYAQAGFDVRGFQSQRQAALPEGAVRVR